MYKMTKGEFMSRFINDKYTKRLKDRQGNYDADYHIYDNMIRIKKRKKSFDHIKSR